MIVGTNWAVNALNKFRIPTLLGLFVIFAGIGAGVFLVSNQQLLTTQASLDPKPQDITIANIQDEGVVVIWKTSDKVAGFVKYGEGSINSVATDDRDKLEQPTKTQPRFDHYVTIKNLAPKTTYLFQINSGKTLFPEIHTFITAASAGNNNILNPLIGTVVDADQPLGSGIAYLTIPKAIVQAVIISKLGNFTIPLSKIYNSALTGTLSEKDIDTAELKVVSSSGKASAKISGELLNQPISLKIGQDIDLTQPTQLKQKEIPKTNIFDLNHDGFVNALDETIVKRSFGKKPKPPEADFNKDGIIDQKDLDLIRQKMNEVSKTS